MSNKTRAMLKFVSILLVLLAVLMQMSIVIIPLLVSYKFWIVVFGFGIMLIASK